MNIEQRNLALSEMAHYADRDAWLSDVALSSVWDDPEDQADIPQERIDALIHLWDAVHLPIRELLAPLTLAQASREFYVPYRTMQDWFAGRRECPVYVRLYLARL